MSNLLTMRLDKKRMTTARRMRNGTPAAGNIMYLRLNSFSEDAVELLEAASVRFGSLKVELVASVV